MEKHFLWDKVKNNINISIQRWLDFYKAYMK